MNKLLYREKTFEAAKFLHTPLMYILMALMAGVIGFLVFKNELIGLGIIGGLLGLTAASICLFNTKLGFFITTVIGFFVFYIKRFTNDALPMGVAVDLLIAVTFLGIYLKKSVYKERLWLYSGNPITYIYLIYVGYLFMQAFNPAMDSIDGWIFTVRKFFNFLMIYFIGLHLFRTRQDIIEYIKLWVVLSGLAGAYGCFQQWHGLLGFELDWVMSDPIRYKLYFQGGDFRKFSFLSDPTAYGILMANTVVFCVILLLNTTNKQYRIGLVAAILFMSLGMAYSGTRTAFFMIPSGLSVYILMTITNKKTMLFAIGFLMMFCTLVFGPFYGNSTINRIRSTFEFSDDESLNVRDENRARIQPYILNHPIGGGVCTSGVLGLEYNPGHPLAGFPPDSGYLRTAIETGYVGLGLTCLIYFIVLYMGVRNYYRSKNNDYRLLYLGIVASLYSYIVANYAQVAIGQMPGSLFFYSAMAVIINMGNIESKQQHKTT
ncbi:O-antigen ligase family protein [Chitinophaga sp. GCM10012297]|uniref:O-antigen ligase family protein n=1 Tax=Chitinophaga chungangae TaxID=2821488 RepID=A0ABS3YIT6_9BACT|nr:O-antigen ligase family protein [Chitinophaga chungangae]MBO9154223.1 O-antigen ligase family protein [Chitinophaga chungangae]